MITHFLFSLNYLIFFFFWLLFWANNNKLIHDKNFIIFVNNWSCIDHGNHYRHLRYHWITSIILSIIFSYLPKKKKKSIVLSLTFFFFFWETSPLPNLRAIIPTQLLLLDIIKINHIKCCNKFYASPTSWVTNLPTLWKIKSKVTSI